jgi:putative SOS response-associated peptidase YedK
MCGRFALSIVAAQFQLAFDCAPPDGLTSSYNVTPDTQIVVIRADEEGRPVAGFARWGLLGAWMKEANDPARQINARAETAAEKPMFRDAFKKGRCLIPATGFYEWQKAGAGSSRPFYVGLASGEAFAFAGLWRRNKLADGSTHDTCAILTIQASSLLEPIHHRMPVILPQASQALWLDPTLKDAGILQALLAPRPDHELYAYEVSRAVNAPRNDGPELIRALDSVQVDQGPAQRTLF